MKHQLIIWISLLLGACACTAERNEQPPEVIPPGMQYIPGGSYLKAMEGGQEAFDVAVSGFLLDKHPVTVADFRAFVQATDYKTDAERFGDAGVFELEKQQWMLVKGACWEYPLGRDKGPAEDDHPVTQVSWNDAMAYCQWAGKRLPTEQEWEYAALSNGTSNSRYSWGNKLTEGDKFMANVWQGKFPKQNTADDGWLYTAPVGLFGKTGHGLSDMGGNVWQWMSEGNEEISRQANPEDRLLKGGSFMCDSSFCHNYQVSGRTFSSSETALFHTGFRCARSL